MVPVPAVDPLVEAVTVTGAVPLVGVTLNCATGGTEAAVTVTTLVAVAVRLVLLVTVAVTV